MPVAVTVQSNVLARASALLCEAPDISHLRPEELAALHVFKHKVLVAGFQLYEKISPETAHPILVKFMTRLVNEIENNIDPP
jgi:hypothetical protein